MTAIHSSVNIEARNLLNAVLQLQDQLKTAFPSKTEPASTLFHYKHVVDSDFCKQGGKLVRIAASFFEEAHQPVAIRGDKGPLRWDTDHSADPQGSAINPGQRTFTILIPAEQKDDTLSFKLVQRASEGIMWQKGPNFTIDLSKHGNIVDMTFSEIIFKQPM
jgi:hypothetical protein